MISFLMLGSLILGLLAWILPIINLMGRRKNWVILLATSISACSISLLFQLLYAQHLVKINDWSALMDTIDASVFASKTLLVVTILLNVATLFVYRERTLSK